VFPVRCSIGYLHFKPGNSEMDEVLKAADAACFKAKQNGRNVICEGKIEDAGDDTENSAKWLPRIHNALQNNLFTLHVQPIMDLSDGSISLYEILLRMIDEDGSLINPEAFIKSAVRYQLALKIDCWVVEEVLAGIAALPPSCGKDGFSINLSAQSIGSEEFLEFLRNQLIHSAIVPSRLCFECRESDVLNRPAVAAEFFTQLRSMGCKTSLDDFGASMTSFSAINMLPLDMIKIDGSFYNSLEGAQPNYQLLESVYQFVSSMGIATVAEQVEMDVTLQKLKALNTDSPAGYGSGYAQGYAVAQPMPFGELNRIADRAA